MTELKAVHDSASNEPNRFKIEGLKEAKAAAAHKIEWTKGPNDKDNDLKSIVVDGVVWAHTHAFHHGMHGKSYTIQQVHGETIQRQDKTRKRNDGFFTVSVSSFRQRDVRRHNPNDPNDKTDLRPTEQRIIDTARELIAEGLLRHPDVVKAEQAEANERYRNNRAIAEEAAKREFRAKAREALESIVSGRAIENTDIDAVVAAMKWAQTK